MPILIFAVLVVWFTCNNFDFLVFGSEVNPTCASALDLIVLFNCFCGLKLLIKFKEYETNTKIYTGIIERNSCIVTFFQ